MTRRPLTLFAVVALGVWLVPVAVQAASLSLVPVKESVFELRGQGLAKVGGIDATLEYDAAALANPRVTAGHLASGALVMANATKPGVIRFAIVQKTRKGISGHGVVATIAFDRLGPASTREMTIRATVVDIAGAKLGVTASIRKKPRIFPFNPGAQPSGPGSSPVPESPAAIPPGPDGSLAPASGEPREEEPPLDRSEPATSRPPTPEEGTEKRPATGG